MQQENVASTTAPATPERSPNGHQHAQPVIPSQPGRPMNPWRAYSILIIPSALGEAEWLTHGAKMTYGALCSFAGRDGVCWASMKEIARKIGVEWKQARRYIHELQHVLLIAVQEREGYRSKYIFLEHPVLDRRLVLGGLENGHTPPESGGSHKREAPLPDSGGPPPESGRGLRKIDSLYESPLDASGRFASVLRVLPPARDPAEILWGTIERITGKVLPAQDPLPAGLARIAERLQVTPAVVVQWMLEISDAKRQQGKPIRSAGFFSRAAAVDFPGWLAQNARVAQAIMQDERDAAPAAAAR
jgi:hypothetical protein